MAIVVLERSVKEPATEEYVEGMRQAAETCFEINDVVRKATYLSEDRRRFVCIFEARDVESVRRSLETVGMDYEHLYAATFF
jgi:hypothetical protein